MGIWGKRILFGIVIFALAGIMVPTILPSADARHNDSHTSNLLLQACPDKCTVFVDQDRDGLCDFDEKRFSMPKDVADRLFAAGVIVACGGGGV